MSRYIDAEWLIALYKPYENYKGREWATSIGTILANIDDAPSIDIVRCKECRWWIDNLTDESTDEDYLECRWKEDEAPNADDFCSYGERRE